MSQVVLVTGCSEPTGFGALTCRRLMQRGHTPYATMRDPAGRSAVTAQALAAEGVHVSALDVADPEQVNEVVGAIVAAEGRIDAVVNNAAWVLGGALEETSAERLLRAFDVNVVGAHRVILAVLPHMRAAGNGTIVQVSSVNGFYPEPIIGVYSATKHAMNAYSDALALEVEQFGIRVVVVEPGMFATGAHDRLDWEPAALDPSGPYAPIRDAIWGGGPQGWDEDVFGDPGDAAEAIVGAIEDPATPLHLPVGVDALELSRDLHHATAVEAWLGSVREELKP